MNSFKKNDWERFGRASKASASEIVELKSWRDNPKTYDVSSYPYQIMIHRAHVVMLAEEGIIGKGEAEKIVKGIKEVEKDSENDPKLVGYMSTETALIKKIGEVGGRMHIGRSRNDLSNTQLRMYYRSQIERLIGSLIDFKKSVLQKAEQNIETIMPGYTHWRQAQPITLAHYLMSHVGAAERSIERLEEIYRRTNLSPLGSTALAGTGWPINRFRTMELLGFDDLCENTLDCVATIDYLIEFAFAIALHMSNLSRLAEDVQVWTSDEYSLFDLDESYSGTSSIMPQKKNPAILELVKSYASESIGNVVSLITSVKGVSYTFTLDRASLEPLSIDTAVGSTNIMAGLISNLTPIKEKMREKLNDGYSTMTDLADILVKKHQIPFRQAHDIVVEVILKALKGGVKSEKIGPEIVSDSSEKILGKRLEISERELSSAINPIQNVKRRKVVGGPAPESVSKMIVSKWREVEAEEKMRNKRIADLKKAYEKLKIAEKALLS